MSVITNTAIEIYSRVVSALVSRNPQQRLAGIPLRSPPVVDAVEFSPAGMARSLADVQVPMGFDRIQGLRTAIEAGEFETPERLAVTVGKLLKIVRLARRA